MDKGRGRHSWRSRGPHCPKAKTSRPPFAIHVALKINDMHGLPQRTLVKEFSIKSGGFAAQFATIELRLSAANRSQELVCSVILTAQSGVAHNVGFGYLYTGG